MTYNEMVSEISMQWQTPTHIEDMLALVALLVVGTSAAGSLPNVNIVNVASRPRHLNILFRTIMSAASSSVQDVEALRQSAFIDIVKRLWWLRPESAHSLFLLLLFLLLWLDMLHHQEVFPVKIV
jgi:hypothetical protein